MGNVCHHSELAMVIINEHSYFAFEAMRKRTLFSAQARVCSKQWHFNMTRQQINAHGISLQDTLIRAWQRQATIFRTSYHCTCPQRLQTKDPKISSTGAKPPQYCMLEFAKSLCHFSTGTNPT